MDALFFFAIFLKSMATLTLLNPDLLKAVLNARANALKE
jgi:hypothetical protein